MLPIRPATTRALVIRKAPQAAKPVYHDAKVEQKPVPALKEGEVLVQIRAAAFNHRDVSLWSRKGQYPGLAFGATMGADGAGVVIASSVPSDSLLQKRVILVSNRGWESDPHAPENPLGGGILGGTNYPPIGTFTDYVVVERTQVIPTPDHLDDVHAAAWPLGGVTAWRASMINARVEKGHNVLITGIGGGVALIALQLCVAKGANVYVTSGTDDKISKAVSLGAKGGVKYRDSDWSKQLEALLKRDGQAHLHAVIDSAGGDIAQQTNRLLKHGGRIVCYGMTAAPAISFTMREVLKNQQLIGSTMGSRQDLIDATAFLARHKIVPVVSHVLDGLDAAERGFELMQKGEQFGKIVIDLGASSSRAKL
ncbi:NAD-P-binding protein [Amylostereum chailletii]|nr:NAD-P-binding protein [Amylostereum chailletii]